MRAFPLTPLVLMVALALSALAGRLDAQRGGGPPQGPPRTVAPIDLTGNWVSVVTMDWRWRMLTPAKGDYLGIPMTAASKKVADAWDPAKDEAAGEQCKLYGAPAIMSVPGRLRISWQDDNTLKVETDAGMQTRLLRFSAPAAPKPGEGGPAATAPRSWQGASVAQWQPSPQNLPLTMRPAERAADALPPSPARGGTLKVVTTNLRAGYLRKNGVPYSADASLTEYWDVTTNGQDTVLTVTTLVDDPLYLRERRLIAYPFKREADGGKWDPTPCSARW